MSGLHEGNGIRIMEDEMETTIALSAFFSSRLKHQRWVILNPKSEIPK